MLRGSMISHVAGSVDIGPVGFADVSMEGGYPSWPVGVAGSSAERSMEDGWQAASRPIASNPRAISPGRPKTLWVLFMVHRRISTRNLSIHYGNEYARIERRSWHVLLYAGHLDESTHSVFMTLNRLTTDAALTLFSIMRFQVDPISPRTTGHSPQSSQPYWPIDVCQRGLSLVAFCNRPDRRSEALVRTS